MSSAHILRCYILLYLICFCVCVQNTKHHPMVKRFVPVWGKSTCITVQLDAQQNFTDLGSPAPQDLSKALFMAVTWRCNMPSQGHEPIGKDGKVDNPIEKPFGQNSSKSDNFNPIRLQYFLTESGDRSLFNVPFGSSFWLQFFQRQNSPTDS